MSCEISTQKPKVYKILYNLNNKGKVYQWNIDIKKTNNNYTIVTFHGETNGKMVKHERIIKEGKANRSCLEQAELEANRKWINKKEKDGYTENIDKVETILVVRPMLAQTFDFAKYKSTRKCKKINFPAAGQRKYDGIRCMTHLENGQIVMESRKGTKFENFDKMRTELFEFLKKLPDTVYLDGELYSYDVPFEVVSGLVRLSTKKATETNINDINKLIYIIYDFVDISEEGLPFDERMHLLDGFFGKKNLNHLKNVKQLL